MRRGEGAGWEREEGRGGGDKRGVGGIEGGNQMGQVGHN